MSAKARILLVVTLAVVTVLSAGAFAYWHFLLRGPFSGATVHDFGDIALFEETAQVEHAFHLTNRLNRPLTIVAIRPECGCLTTRDLKQTLQPGESFDLPVTLVVKGGPRTVIIHVAFDDGSTTALRVKANGKYQPRLWMSSASVALSDDGTAEFTLMLDTYGSYDAPIAPTITSSDPAVHIEFGGWTLKYRPKDVVAAPTNWQSTVRVRRSENAAAEFEGASLEVAWPPAKPLTVAVQPPAAR